MTSEKTSTSDDAPSGGRMGPRGGRWTSQERQGEAVASRDDEPGNGWDNIVRVIEDALTAAD